ncbi:hypothetical protein HDU80_011601 [Chytriomyces hyalinus]|nr:hypothetical protein HDU80_011601 [Chytriomyces hyalinus]
MSDTDPSASEELALADHPPQRQAVDASIETQGTSATPTPDSTDTTATADLPTTNAETPTSSDAATVPTGPTTTSGTVTVGQNLSSIRSVGSAIVPRPVPPTAGAPAPPAPPAPPKPTTTFAGGAVTSRSGSSVPAPNPTVSQEPILSVPGSPPRISTSDIVFPQTSAPSLPSALPVDSIPSIAPAAPPPAPAPAASADAFLPAVVSPIQSASIQTLSPELPTSNASPTTQSSSPTSIIITSTARAAAGIPPPPLASISAVPPTSANSTAQPQLSTALIGILVTFGIVITVAAAAFVAVYKRKLSRDAKQKKRQIPKTLAPSVSNEYLGDTERGVGVRGRVSMASSVDVPSIDGNPTSNVYPDAMSSDGVYFWPFAARVDTEEEEECTSPTRIDGATTAVDTGGNTSHYYTDTEDGAVKKRVPSFELLLPGAVHAASDEAFSYYGFGASRIPRLNALEPQGVVIVNEPFEMEDGLGGVAYMTDSGETNLLTGGHQSQRNVSTRSSREHRFNSSSPSSIVKSLSTNVSVEGHHSLSRKTLTGTTTDSLVDNTATTDTLVSTTASSNSTTFSIAPPNAGGVAPTAGAGATVNTVPSNPGPASSFVASTVVDKGAGSDASNPTNNARTQLNTTNVPGAARTDGIPTASQTNQPTSNGSITSIAIGIAAMLAVFLAIVGAVVVRRKKLPPTANKRAHKKRYIGRTDFSNSTEYFADAENGPSSNDTSNDDNDFDGDVPQAPKPIQQQQQRQQNESQSADFSWPFATPRTIEETSDDTVVAQRGLISESEDGARDMTRKPSFELMQDTTTSAKIASEAFNYFGFGSNRLPTLHPLPSHSMTTGVQVTSGEFEYATVSLGLPAGATLDQYAGEACFTDSGETDSAAAPAQRDMHSSSNSSIIKHIASSPPIAVISENPLERKVSEKGVIDE